MTDEQYNAEMLEIYCEAQANGGRTTRTYHVSSMPHGLITRFDTIYGFGVVLPVRPDFAVRLQDAPWYVRLWNYLWGRA